MSSESSAKSWEQAGKAIERPLFVEPSEVFDRVQEVLGRKWHLRLVYQLLENGPMGFSGLKRETAGISSKMLSESLSSLEENGIVHRSVVNEQPVRVEYTLTEQGEALEGVVSALMRWGYEFEAGEAT
jgi:DNA-binding HxlR family transcriptional regulator